MNVFGHNELVYTSAAEVRIYSFNYTMEYGEAKINPTREDNLAGNI